MRPARSIASVLAAMMAAATAAHAAEPIVDFVVQRSDTLIGLSNSVLVSSAAWREVAQLNRLPNPNRIRPGQVLRIPERLMRSAAAPARLVSVAGDVRVDDAAAAAGGALGEGQSVQTGAGGSVVIELADGSRLRLPPSSLVQVAASRTYASRPSEPGAAGASGGWFAGSMRLLRGSVEVFATKVLRAKPLEIVTPTAVVGVRGTEFRVGFDEAANGRGRSEVIEGAVRFELLRGNAGADLATGFGAAADAAGAPPQVARLLAAPDLSALPDRFERPLVRFQVAAEPSALRVQVASDDAFDKVISDQVIAAGSEVRIAGLADAQWYLRARRIDTQGLEGFDAKRAFVLKARPEPPAYRTPRSGAKQAVGSVEFAWAPNANAPQVQLQVAEDAAFTRLVQNRDGLSATTLRTDIAAAGTYYWRLASVRGDGDHGPFGDPQPFELRPTPEPPRGGASADGSALMFTWSGRAQDRQQVELARDAAFAGIVARDELAASEWTLPRPASGGRYYFRYRSVEPDGYVSPYSETLQVDLPRDWSPLWLLLPLLLVL